MSSDKKIITVFGATGSQGGGLVDAILNEPESGFAVRAVTRDETSDKAKKLADRGAEIVVADVDDYESMVKALSGAYGAYFVTFFWAHMSPERELEEARKMAKAAKEAGIQHAVWSTLEDVREYVPLSDDSMPTIHGKYKVPHFDAKGEANKFFIEIGVPTTFLYTAFYWDNFVAFGMGPKRGEDGKLALTFPMGEAKLSGIASEDIGKCAFGIFKKGQEMIGQSVGIAGEHLPVQQMADIFTRMLGEDVRYNAISFEVYRNLGFPGADDLGNMFQFYHDFADQFVAKRNVEKAKELNPELKSFEQWLSENLEKIPL